MRTCLALVAVALASCAVVPRTQVIVTIDAEAGVRAAAPSLHLVVLGGEGATVGPTAERFDRVLHPGTGDPGFPFSIAIAPLDHDVGRVYEVTATALDASDGFVAEVRAVSGFVEGRTLHLRLVLQDACRGRMCARNETCRGGACRVADVRPEDLPVFGTDAGSMPDDAAEPVDGGPVVAGWEAALVAPPGSDADDLFGRAVAISRDGTRALVGAFSDDTTAGTNAGSARVFVRTGTTWAEEAMLMAPDGAVNDYFGTSVALSADGSRAVIGASGDDTAGGAEAGSARVFLRTGSTWAEEATLLAPDGAANDGFGESVALTADGSRALVGAPRDDTATGTDAGSARVFLRSGTTWIEEATLTTFPVAEGLGAAVALTADGSRALVAGGGGARGAPAVFIRTGTIWMQEAILTPVYWPATSVALSDAGDVALLGTPYEDTAAGSQAGTAHVFARTGSAWSESHTFASPEPIVSGRFGFSVALSVDGRRALIGECPTEATPLPGTAYVFVGGGATWTDVAQLNAPDGMSGDQFGWSAALSGSGTLAIVGSQHDDTAGGVNAGSAHVFTLTP